MSKATCRCGQPIVIPNDGTERVVCPKCHAKIRIRKSMAARPDDGFVRFNCPCGRRLKVRTENDSTHGKCPECGRVVPVPSRDDPRAVPPAHPGAPTVDLTPQEIAALDAWSREWNVRQKNSDEQPTPVSAHPPLAPVSRAEAGFRICPKCLKPLHLGSEMCRTCGIKVPRN